MVRRLKFLYKTGSTDFKLTTVTHKHVLLLGLFFVSVAVVFFVIVSSEQTNSYLDNADKSSDQIATQYGEQPADNNDQTDNSGGNKRTGSSSNNSTPQGIVHPTLADCQKNNGLVKIYYYLYGGTDGYATTGQSIPSDSNYHSDVFSTDSYRSNVYATEMNCPKDNNGNYVDGWLDIYLIKGTSTYVKYSDVSITPPAPMRFNNTITVPELGIKFGVPDGIKDLAYTVSTGQLQDGRAYTRASFSTPSLSALNPSCASDGSKPAFGWLAKVDGLYSTTYDENSGDLVKQFPAFYISRNSTPAFCMEGRPRDEYKLWNGQKYDFDQSIGNINNSRIEQI